MAYNQSSDGLFSGILNRYGTTLTQLFNTVEDIRVKSSYADVLKDLDEAKIERDNYKKFKTMNQKLLATDYDVNDLTQVVMGVDETSELIKEDVDYKTYLGMGGKIGGFNTYLQDKPELLKKFEDQNLVYTHRVPYKDEQLTLRMFDKAGYTPEDVKFYNDYKARQVTPQEFNAEVMQRIMRRAPNLMSRNLGTSYLGLALSSAQSLQLPEDKVSYQNVGGELYAMSSDNPYYAQKLTTKVGDQDEKKENWFMRKDDDGVLHWYASVKVGNEWQDKKIRPVEESELNEKLMKNQKEFLQMMKIESDIRKNEATIFKLYNPKGTGKGKGNSYTTYSVDADGNVVKDTGKTTKTTTKTTDNKQDLTGNSDFEAEKDKVFKQYDNLFTQYNPGGSYSIIDNDPFASGLLASLETSKNKTELDAASNNLLYYLQNYAQKPHAQDLLMGDLITQTQAGQMTFPQLKKWGEALEIATGENILPDITKTANSNSFFNGLTSIMKKAKQFNAKF